MLHIHRAERADRLADGLAETLAAPLDDPFTPDVVAVPTRGIERWLTQRLATRLGTSAEAADGVCANVEFPFPGRLIQSALAAATGLDPERDPWLPERSVWPLLTVVDEYLAEPWLAALATHLEGARGGAEEPPRRFGVVRHVADLFDRYGVHRPDMVREWAAGGEGTAGGGWQPELWRRLRERIGAPSPAERLERACARIRREPAVLKLPERLSAFGLTRMPLSYLEVLTAIASEREVHLFVLHPSPSLWSHVAEQLAGGPAITTRRHDRTAALPVNRLLASWGRDARELQLVLAGAGAGSGEADSVDHHHELPADEPRTLLGAIQRDIREDLQPPGPPALPSEPDVRPRLHPDDRSIQIHACHGRARQVDVLRDAVLHLLAEDPTLEPRDVIVMCPDIETFAPLIQATFGSGGATEDEEDDLADPSAARLPDLRVRLADRALRQTNPVLGVISQVLALADQRATASQLLDLAAREPVRRRFGFDDDDLSRMQDWVAASGIRWGFDAPHREPFKLGMVRANTWRRGLDRLLVGVAMTEEERPLVGGVLALDDVESGAIDLAGRFAEFVDRVQAAVDAFSHPQPISGWTEAVASAADSLTATSDRNSWQRRELQRLLEDVAAESANGGAAQSESGSATGDELEASLELADVRVLLADRLRGRPTRANFRSGHLTVCTLVPMRSVPHRVVCILGLDDGEYPRRARRDGDDLMLAEPHVGDRDPRAEDRQMLLDALLAATERLIITYTGNDERTNVRRPPAVPVGELLDVVERTVRFESGRPRDAVEIHHPLQPFDPRNFLAGKLVAGRPWGFDPQALAGARALSGRRVPRGPFLPEPLPPRPDPVVELGLLTRFVEHPTRALLRDRLGISVSDYFDEVEDAMPVELDALEEWGVGQRLLDGVLAGGELRACMEAEIARGALPPGELARPTLARIGGIVEQVAEAARALAPGEPGSLDVSVALPDGRTLAGTVTGVCGEQIRAVSFSRVRPRDRLRGWVRLLALSAARPDQPFESVVIGRARAGVRGAAVTVARIPPLASGSAGARAERRRTALEQLAVILDLYDRGMREPLPLACDSSAAYAQATLAGEDGEAAARAAWETVFRYDKEDRQPEHMLVYGEAIPFARLLEQAPRGDEGWEAAEATRFGRYALRLWRGLLGAEELSDR
ncbi:MAG: exodeoxyribonuclease V subunit gamma [Solirubrobacterales bacterium]|nr:exodeoxyribonuclease V subunit gamma [Solirubrobacterales bacterium]